MRPDDLVVTDLKGVPVKDGKASSEIKLHTAIYQHREDCMAVVHAHPPVATSLPWLAKTSRTTSCPRRQSFWGRSDCSISR
ncbi:MAG: class II aldolase/adducin family protein [Fimbriimonadaceae bacterium]